VKSLEGDVKKLLQLALSLFFLLSPAASAHEKDNPLAGLDAYIEKAMRDWDVPGLAIAVVKDDKVILAKGYGVREAGKNDPVDENTVFAIGSNTKAFTATALGILVQEKKISWDDHVTDWLKGFQLYQPWVTREITVRDLLCHRSGLPPYGGDLLWYGTDYDRAEILRRVRYLKPVSSFRHEYAYQNLMYLASGQIIPAVTGKSWDEFIKTRLLQPLGMRGSGTSVRELKAMDNVAAPHMKIGGKVAVIPYRNVDNIAPAGAINSSIVDMTQWLRLQLGRGTYNGAKIVEPGVIEETRSPHTPMRMPPDAQKMYPSTHFLAYGLGWVLQDYHGRLLVWHTGGIDGMLSLIGIVPEERLGMVVLTNSSGHALHSALFYRTVDAVLGQPTRDWSALNMEQQKKSEARMAEMLKKVEQSRVQGTRPSLPLSAYAAVYEDDLYGNAQVAEEGERLVLRYSSRLTADLAHWHFNTFRVTWRDPVAREALSQETGFVTFELDAKGKVTEMKLGDIASFRRAPEPRSGTTEGGSHE
jgi:CubicO group peptidase (beta-lactamase class C family)